ncbi:MAG: hydantoinase B/oxoprolinase family protein [Rhodospirillales bacterium]
MFVMPQLDKINLKLNPKWQFWIDRGGTFTDVIARAPDGTVSAYKLLSENPDQYADAAVQGIKDVLGDNCKNSADMIDAIKMGTTVATNALLERRGEPVVLAITQGLKDQLRIGYQNRPKIFARHIELPEMLYTNVIEVEERVSAKGEIICALNVDTTKQSLEKIYASGIRAIAVVFMHGYRYPDHERQVADLARDIGFTQISVSHRVSPLMKLVARGDTTVADAYLSPILRRYVDSVAAALGETRLMFMQSNGGLTDADLFQGKDSILSGPAGGVVGMARTAEQAGFQKVIGFDMGGTSTDVSHYDGSFERTFDTTVAGVRLQAPMMRIHTVAAGGGSILHFDGGRLRAGPDSAGADPGPACYRRGGPLCVTDCNVMLGRIQPDFFPSVFGPGADERLDAEATKTKFTDITKDVNRETNSNHTPEEIAEGFLTIAIENMANAIKHISVQRGYDISEYALNCFGGAAGQHACRVADTLGINTVLIHEHSGVLSAFGMGLADIRALREKTVEAPLGPQLMPSLKMARTELKTDAVKEIRRQGIEENKIGEQCTVYLKYAGTDTALPVAFGDPAAMQEQFENAHRRQFGFVMTGREMIVEAISVEAIGAANTLNEIPSKNGKTSQVKPTKPEAIAPLYIFDRWTDAPVYIRDKLHAGNTVKGPALIAETNATIVIEPGWQAEKTGIGNLVLSRFEARASTAAVGTDVDPVTLEIFNNLFMSIAEQMGAVLGNTSYSVNIKERLDYSCALFDGDGQLIANAPHIPVHLGSMGESVQAVIRDQKESMKPGDVWVLNAPYNGGTHLPDITVVTPVFDESQSDILFYTASRGHHADIGGMTPGSMPPDSRTLDDEGVLIDNFLLVEQGQFREQALRELLNSGKWPARNPDQNIADLKAQIAANEKGVQELLRMVEHFGRDAVTAYMKHVQDNAEECVRRAIETLNNGTHTCELDNGAIIKVNISIDRDRREAIIDFTGTSAQLSNNFNAPFAVTRAAVLYVFRTLVDDDIPLNAGCLKPLKIVMPEDCVLNPQYPAAVVAGNVETSQVIVNTLYGALGIMAAAQGTMNNFTFGNDEHQYYETICGGTGAGDGYDGTDAVQAHMTNSRLTDPEVLEWRHPVLVESFAIRPDSGGNGKYRGGNGIIRRIQFREAMTAAILSNNRRVRPFGIEGGGKAQPGRTYIKRKNGETTELGATDEAALVAGDRIIIETPGGGGFGKKNGA